MRRGIEAVYTMSSRATSVFDVASRSGRRIAALLAAMLLFAAWAEAGHMADIEAHEGSVCEVCLFAGASGHGMAPGVSLLLPHFALLDRPALPDTAQIPSFLLRRVHGQRAPPAFS